MAHYYTQNGDTIADLDVVYDVRTWMSQEITQPQAMMMGGYQEIVLADGRYYPQGLKDEEKFSRMWAKNIREQRWWKGAEVVSLSHPELTAVGWGLKMADGRFYLPSGDIAHHWT